MEELTYAQEVILQKVQEKQKPQSFDNYNWGEYMDYGR